MTKLVKKEEKIQVDIDNQSAWDELMEKQGLKVVDVYQEWSGPCESLMNIFRRLKVEINDDLLTGASAPEIENSINQLLAQEHEIIDGVRTRTVIEDTYTREIQEAKEAEARRKARETVTSPLKSPIWYERCSKYSAIQLQENDFQVLFDEERVLATEILSTILEDEQEDEDYEDRLNLFSSGPSRCLLIIKGSQGIFDEIIPFFTLHKTEETKNQETGALQLQEPDVDDMNERQVESIRDKYGNGNHKAIVKFWESKETANNARKVLFPNFTPAKVIARPKEEEPPGESYESLGKEDGSVNSGSLKGSEDLKSQSVLIVILPTASATFRVELMATLNEANFEIKLTREFVLSEDNVREFCNMAKIDFNNQDLVNEMTSGTTVVLVASKCNAFETMKKIIASESFSEPSENEPHSPRAQYSVVPGTEKTSNLPWIYNTHNTEETLAWTSHFFPTEETLAGIRTDKMLQETLEAISHAGFEIVAQQEHQMVEEDVRFLYQEYADQPLMEDLVNNLKQSSITFLVLRAPAAISSWRVLMGCSDVETGFAAPNTGVQSSSSGLRAIYGSNIMENAVFASTTAEGAKKCIEYVFGPHWTAEADNEHDSHSSSGEQ
ncbi:Thioredoxin domain-containing protein 3 [Sparganum proliferum]